MMGLQQTIKQVEWISKKDNKVIVAMGIHVMRTPIMMVFSAA